MAAKVGQKAPYWEGQAVVPGGEFKTLKLSDYEGKWLVFFFYPLDFTFVCPTEIKGYSARYEDFRKRNADIVGASTDSVYSHQAWLKELGELRYPLLSDNSHEIARKYGILVEEKGIALRGTFIVDDKGVLRYSVVHDLSVGRSVDETLRVLEALQSGQLCPVDWHPGQKTLG